LIRAYPVFLVGVRAKKLYPAIKHGASSATGLLPGQVPVAFEKLHRDLISDLCPNGPLEEDTVADIARCIWRKQNLASFRIAKAGRRRHLAMTSEMIPSPTALVLDPYGLMGDSTKLQAARETLEARAREELGENYKFVEMARRRFHARPQSIPVSWAIRHITEVEDACLPKGRTCAVSGEVKQSPSRLWVT
jgi:hypothetical protein